MDQHPKLCTCPDNRTNFSLIEVVSYTVHRAHSLTHSLPPKCYVNNKLSHNKLTRGKRKEKSNECAMVLIEYPNGIRGTVREEKGWEKTSKMEGGCEMGNLLIVSNYTPSPFLILFSFHFLTNWSARFYLSLSLALRVLFSFHEHHSTHFHYSCKSVQFPINRMKIIESQSTNWLDRNTFFLCSVSRARSLVHLITFDLVLENV